MKAKELMIGDFVRVSKDVCIKKGTIVRVRAIDGDNRFPEKGLIGCASCEQVDDRSVSGGVWCEYLEPSPLTAEILEKNGFRFDGSGQRSMMLATPYGDSGTRWSIYVGLKHKTIEAHSAPPVERKPGWRKSNKACLEVCGCFVHELQHLLRLCGIEKEIVI